MLSRSTDVQSWACRVMAKLGYDISNSVISDDAWRWFVTPAVGGLDAVVACYRSNAELKPALFPILEQFAKKHFADLFSTHLRSALPALSEFLFFVTDFLVRVISSHLWRVTPFSFLFYVAAVVVRCAECVC